MTKYVYSWYHNIKSHYRCMLTMGLRISVVHCECKSFVYEWPLIDGQQPSDKSCVRKVKDAVQVHSHFTYNVLL